MCAALLFFSYTLLTHVYYNREITPNEYQCLTDMRFKYRRPVKQYQFSKVVKGAFSESKLYERKH